MPKPVIPGVPHTPLNPHEIPPGVEQQLMRQRLVAKGMTSSQAAQIVNGKTRAQYAERLIAWQQTLPKG